MENEEYDLMSMWNTGDDTEESETMTEEAWVSRWGRAKLWKEVIQ